jgi:hypothetical protein
VPCGTGNTCTTSGGTSTCQPAGVVGASCGSDDQCASGFCDPNADKCTNGLTFALGATDCNAIEGPTTAPEAGGTTTTTEAGATTGSEAGASTSSEASVSDAPTGG